VYAIAAVAFFLGINSALALNLYATSRMPLDNPTLAEKLATAIADGILDGTLRPGAISTRRPRAAARRVAHAGARGAAPAHDQRPDRDAPAQGAVVAKATPQQIESLFVAMAEMEATCARLCALSMTPVERRRLQARQEEMLALAEAGDPDAYADANVAFHSAIYAGAHNTPLADYAMACAAAVGPFRRAQFRLEGG
jgi:DNA-binding GntR family transcriptional regulator